MLLVNIFRDLRGVVLWKELFNVGLELDVQRQVGREVGPAKEDEDEAELASDVSWDLVPFVAKEAVDAGVLLLQGVDVFGQAVRVVILFVSTPAFCLDLVVQDHGRRNDHHHKEEVDDNHDAREQGNTSNGHDRVPGVSKDDNCRGSIGPEEAAETSSQYEGHPPLQLSLEDVRAELSGLEPGVEHHVDVI